MYCIFYHMIPGFEPVASRQLGRRSQHEAQWSKRATSGIKYSSDWLLTVVPVRKMLCTPGYAGIKG